MHGATPPYTLMPSWHAKNSPHAEDSSSKSTGGGGGGGSSSSSGSQITVVITVTTGVHTPVDLPTEAA